MHLESVGMVNCEGFSDACVSTWKSHSWPTDRLHERCLLGCPWKPVNWFFCEGLRKSKGCGVNTHSREYIFRWRTHETNAHTMSEKHLRQSQYLSETCLRRTLRKRSLSLETELIWSPGALFGGLLEEKAHLKLSETLSTTQTTVSGRHWIRMRSTPHGLPVLGWPQVSDPTEGPWRDFLTLVQK